MTFLELLLIVLSALAVAGLVFVIACAVGSTQELKTLEELSYSRSNMGRTKMATSTGASLAQFASQTQYAVALDGWTINSGVTPLLTGTGAAHTPPDLTKPTFKNMGDRPLVKELMVGLSKVSGEEARERTLSWMRKA